MPTWGQILDELNQPENARPDGRPDYDKVRRRYLAALSQRTDRAVIAYGTAFLDRDAPLAVMMIQLGDLQGFMNAVADVQQRDLDLIITSPGGYSEATESIVAYLRTRFDHIRALIPVAAMSAGTMLALGCDELVMGTHSQLGPIDPQFTLSTPDGPRSAPGQAILDQFEQAKQECAENPQNIAAWMPILRSYAPGLVAMCHDQRELAKRMVRQWLEQHMLRDDPDGATKAARAAEWFADYEYFGSHGRRVSLQDIQALGLRATALEEDQDLQDAVLSVHHSFSLTHSNTPAAKIIENHLGRAYVKLVGEVLVQPPPPPAGPRPPQTSTPSTRAERRRQERQQRGR